MRDGVVGRREVEPAPPPMIVDDEAEDRENCA